MVENEGEKSWEDLFARYYGGTKSGDPTNGGTIVVASSFSFLRSGYYAWSNGGLNTRARYGLYWSIKDYSGPLALNLGFSLAWLGYQDGNVKGFGFSLR